MGMEKFGAQVMDTLKSGVINGPTLYATQKLVTAVDMAASNLAGTKLPQEIRTPLVGLALALIPEVAFGGRGYAGKVAEYTLANAVAQTIALAGNGGTGAPGVIDQKLNELLAPVATLGMKGYVAGSQRGFINTTSNSSTQGLRKPMRGFVTEHF